MRTTFVMVSLIALIMLACAVDAFGHGRRRSSCDHGGVYYYHDGRAYYDAGPGMYYAEGVPFEARQSFYFDPNQAPDLARTVILLPNADAEVWFDGAATQQRGRQRMFETHALQGEGTYMIRARWTENGKTINQERRVTVRPGQTQTVDFNINAQERVPAPLPPK